MKTGKLHLFQAVSAGHPTLLPFIKILQQWSYIENLYHHTLPSFLPSPLTQVAIIPYEKVYPSHWGASKQFLHQNLVIREGVKEVYLTVTLTLRVNPPSLPLQR